MTSSKIDLMHASVSNNAANEKVMVMTMANVIYAHGKYSRRTGAVRKTLN
jgi:hypothetical protein